ncbi:MAG: ParA family protein [Calditrichaceae bacterium]|nr:ParA family protein [Calditrichaceae bacterium]RQV94665.1 MAG: ParA family protein [Calditrichota bacterium]
MKLIVMINNKGGVGKTTSAVNIAAWLAKMGEKTLLVDLDPSASASIHLGFEKVKNNHQTLCDFIINGGSDLTSYIYPSIIDKLDCLPSEPALGEFYDDMQQETEAEFFLDKKKIPAGYRFVIFDSPPNMGNLAMNALAIADYVLIPVQTQYLALSGLELTLKLIDKAQRHLNNQLKILGVFGTHYDRRTNVAKEVYQILQDKFGSLVFDTVIGVNSKLIEAYHAQKPIMLYSASARGSKEYKQLTKEIHKRIKKADG